MIDQDIQAKIDASTQLLDEARIYFTRAKFDESKRCASEVCALLELHVAEADTDFDPTSQKNALIGLLAKTYNRLYTISMAYSDYALALSQAETGIRYCDRIGEFTRKADLLFCIANIYHKQSDYSKAMDYYKNAISLAEKHANNGTIAACLDGIGLVYMNLSDYPQALEYYGRALHLSEQIGNAVFIPKHLGKIGTVYKNISDYTRALEYYSRALDLEEKLGNINGVAGLMSNIGTVYSSLSEYETALDYYRKALAIMEEQGDKESISILLGNIGSNHWNLSEFDLALDYFTRALALAQEVGYKYGMALHTGNIGNVYQHLPNYNLALYYYNKALSEYQELKNVSGVAHNLNNIGVTYSKLDFDGHDFDKSAEYYLRSIALFEEIGNKSGEYVGYKNLSDLYRAQKKWEEADKYFQKFYEREKEVQSVEAKKQADKLAYELQTAEREKQMAVERALATATNEILANILPPNITKRLLGGEKKIADTYESVSVLFIDIVGFTKMSAKIPAGELIDILDVVFSNFDTICKKYGLEKIKTIGDAYMAVCGAPIPCENHAERAARAALEMLNDFVNEEQFSTPINLSFRIGLHTGSVVAGIIGENKYSYDLWGDAVNTASRMESHGEAGKIHVSEEFKQALQKGLGLSQESPMSPKSLHFQERGEMAIKGKGMMKTYFLEKL